MNRRDFLKTSAVSTTLLSNAPALALAQGPAHQPGALRLTEGPLLARASGNRPDFREVLDGVAPLGKKTSGSGWRSGAVWRSSGRLAEGWEEQIGTCLSRNYFSFELNEFSHRLLTGFSGVI